MLDIGIAFSIKCRKFVFTHSYVDTRTQEVYFNEHNKKREKIFFSLLQRATIAVYCVYAKLC